MAEGAKHLGPDDADGDQAGTNRLELCFALPTHISPVRRWDKLLLRKLSPRQTAALDHCKLVADSEADEDQTETNSLELCFALPTQISPVRCWDKLLLRKLSPHQTADLDHCQLVPDKADEDQAGTNSLELCFALPTQISPVHRWDKLLPRKLNPRQTAALDHYKSHPQIFVAICNFEDYKTFLLLPTAEIGVVFLFLFYNIYPSDFSLQLPVHPLPFRRGHRPFF